MEDEREQIKIVEKPSIKRVTSEIYNNNNTSGYVSDSSENDVVIDTEVSEIVAPQGSIWDNLSNQLSDLAAGESTSGECDDIIDADFSKLEASEGSSLDDLRNQLSGLTAGGSQAVNHETFSVPEQLPVNKTSDSAGSFKFPSPPKDSPTDNEEHEPASADEMNAIHSRSSQSSLDSNSYWWSLALFDLPLKALHDDEEKILWPLKEQFSLKDQWKFKEDSDYRLATEIGAGAFGKCYVGAVQRVNTEEERVFCVKKCEYKMNEILVLSLARWSKIAEIVEFYGATVKGKNVRIFMEYMAGGTIAELIKEREISQEDSLRYLEVVLKALEFLHCKGIVHRDIKGDNVLLDLGDDGFLSAKLADFGSAESTAMEREVRPSFDIWKTGCLLLEMLNRERPLRLIDERALQRQNSCNPVEYFPPQAMDITKQLLRLLFGLDGSIPTAAAVLKHSGAFPVAELLNRLPKES